MKKFDYKTESITPIGNWGLKLEDYEKILNQYGEEGYELVSILPGINISEPVHIFKKEK